MGHIQPIWSDPAAYLARIRPEEAVLFLDPNALAHAYARFQRGFPGLVTYAVKANPERQIIDRLTALGMNAYDVASPSEIDLVRAACPDARLHYHNPIRSRREIALAKAAGVASYSVDCLSELDKLAEGLADHRVDVAVRFALPLAGASYDFGSKFGATPAMASELLARAAALGFTPAITFHPGTQCTDPKVWAQYIAAAAGIAEAAGVRPARLNVGGGFPSARDGHEHDLGLIFQTIRDATAAHFPDHAPELVCEPGRAMVSDALSLAVMVKAVRGGDLFLADGIYGTLGEQHQIGLTRRLKVIPGDGIPRGAEARDWRVFGPTCDSLDVLPEAVSLPADMAEGDHILFHSLGAYSTAMATRFNGYGTARLVPVQSLYPA
ncbi:MAG: type III PLP-dependent enzyme [Rhodobacteraceae bacterium]|nr:type III PLP-dependent enzyme [Paracoccaceae bacterium]